jgi:hypothetical protein
MGPQLTTLTSSDIQRFERDGYVVVRQAFSRADGLAMERRWWSELQARILTGRVRGVFDDLLGKAAWSPPRNWGRSLVTFPEPGAWEAPTRHWHWDSREPAARFDRSWRSPDMRRHRPTGSPLSWTVKPSSKACPFAWSN